MHPESHWLYFIDSSERYVYHYTKYSTLVEKVLPSSQIKLSGFSRTNDPREYKNWTFGFGTRSDFAPDFSTGAIEKRASELLKAKSHVFCTVADGLGSTEPSIDNIYERGFCRPRMWAQYAEDHSGACLVFDRVRLDEAMRECFGSRNVFSGAVAYKNRPRAARLGVADPFMLDCDAIRASGLEEAIETHFYCFYKQLFLEKSKDWADEREYRWLVRTPDTRDLYLSTEHAMKGVVVGDRCSIDQRNKVHGLVANRNIAVGIMNWKSGIPEVLLSQPGLRWGCRAE